MFLCRLGRALSVNPVVLDFFLRYPVTLPDWDGLDITPLDVFSQGIWMDSHQHGRVRNRHTPESLKLP